MKRATNFLGFTAEALTVFLLFFGGLVFGQVSSKDRIDPGSNSAHLVGVVTYRDSQRGILFVQDSAGGVAVDFKNGDNEIVPGISVQVIGSVSQGTLTPVITKAKVTPMGPGKFPAPRPTSRWKLVTGTEEAQWVELQSVIQNVAVTNNLAILDVGSGKSLFRAQLPVKNEKESESLSNLIDASCRLRGVASAFFNPNGQLAEVQLCIPGIEHIAVEKAAPEINSLPITRVRNLPQFLPFTGNIHRVRIRGIVNWQRLGRGLSIQDETDGTGVYIQTSQSLLLRPGDLIEAAGFIDRSQFSPYMRCGILRKIRSIRPPVARSATPEELIQGARDYQLVRIEGDLTEKSVQDGDLVLTLRNGRHLFNAHLHGTKADGLDELEPGSRLKLTGVCWVLVDDKLKPRNFRLMLRSHGDIIATQKPGWWTFQRIMILLTVMTFVLAMALLWAVTLRRKVRENTERLRQQFEREAAFAALGHKLSGAITPKDAARIILDTAQGIFGWDAGAIRLHDATKKQAESIIDVDTIDGKRVEVDVPASENIISPIMRKVFAQGPQLILRKKSEESGKDFLPFGDKGRPSASLMFVPLRDSAKNIGMLSIQSYTPDAYDREDLERLQKLADHCGAALLRIWAEEMVRKTNAELEQRVAQRTAELGEANDMLRREIEKHKRTEAILAKEQQLFQNFMETVPDSVYFKDTRGRFIRVNQEKLRRFNLRDAAQIFGKTDFDFFGAEDARRMQTEEEEIMATGQPMLAREEKIVRLDGSVTWMLTSKMPLRNEEGEIVGTFGVTRDITRQKMAEQTLNYSQHLLETIMNHVPDYIYFKDLEGHFVRVNLAFANQFGACEPQEMIGKTDADFLSEEAARESYEDEQRIIRTAVPVLGKEEHEFWLDGHEWWALTSKMPFRDETGKIIGTFGVTRDITQRKKAEEALRLARQELEQRVQERTSELMRTNDRLLEEIGDRIEAELRTSIFSNLGYWLSGVTQAGEAAKTILDVADQLLGWDAAYIHLFTPEPRRVVPILIYDTIDGKRTVLPDDGGELISERDRRLIEKGAELVLRKSGNETDSLVPFGSEKLSQSLMFVPIRNGANVVGAMSIQSYTIDAYNEKDLNTLQALGDFCSGTLERILAEQALRKSEEHFSKTFLSCPIPMTLSTLKDGRYLNANDAMFDLMGFSREEMINKTSLELGVWPAPEARAKLVDAISKNRSVRDMECELRTKSGQLRKTLLSAELMDFGGEPTILVSVHDLTERLGLEERLRQSQKMEAIGQLAAGIAHDFNNILTIVQGHTALLLETSDLDSNAQDALRQVTEASERAANLTRQLLAFSRKQRMQPRALDLNEVISNSSKMLQQILGESNTLQLGYSSTLPVIFGDSSMLEQVLLNLTLNARDAMSGGKLVIATDVVLINEAEAESRLEAQPGNFARLTVSDNGCGMSQSMLAKIFEPFFTTKEVGKGTGLGLATVYGIVKQHHGWIEVESSVGRGTTFRIYLPAAEKNIRTIRDTPMPSSETTGGDETILVVEDEPALRSLVKNILEVYGYSVIEAAHGKEALVVWQKNKNTIDLLLTDIVMPEGISGIDLAEMLRKDEPELKVIFTSGYSAELFKGKQTLIEGRNFLPKPYQPRLLAQTIRTCFDEVANGSPEK